MNTILILTSFILSIFFDALADANQYIYDKTKDKIFMIKRHSLQSMMVACFFLLLLIESITGINLLLYVCTYILFRFAIFDVTFNIGTGRDARYIGESSLYDKILGWIFKGAMGKNILMLVRMISFTGALYLIQRVLPL